MNPIVLDAAASLLACIGGTVWSHPEIYKELKLGNPALYPVTASHDELWKRVRLVRSGLYSFSVMIPAISRISSGETLTIALVFGAVVFGLTFLIQYLIYLLGSPEERDRLSSESRLD